MSKTQWATLLSALLIAPAPMLFASERDAGMRAYERGHYVEAQSRLLRAAAEGDAAAQELVGLMYTFGPHLYPGVLRDLRAAHHWLRQAALNGRPSARYMYCALDRRIAMRAADLQCVAQPADHARSAAR